MVKCLPCKFEDLSLSPRVHVKLAWWPGEVAWVRALASEREDLSSNPSKGQDIIACAPKIVRRK